jgi:hypothetical protein
MPEFCYEYLAFYKKYALNWWNHIGPMEYLLILTVVGVMGYVMMLKSPKQTG